MLPSGLTEDEFRARVREVNDTTIGAIYKVLDELDAVVPKRLKVPKLACRPGCSICCNELVCVTLPEWGLIQDLLSEMDPDLALRRALDRGVEEFLRATDGGRRLTSDQRRFSRLFSGKPCIFLVQNRCAVYPARPLVCRTTFSTTRCRSLKQKGAGQMRFDYDVWANNLAMMSAARVQRAMAVIPIPHLVQQLLQAQPNLLRPNH